MAFLPYSGIGVDSLLQNVGVLYRNPNAWYRQIVPVLPGDLKGEYPIFDAEAQAFRDVRAEGTKRINDSCPPEYKFKYTLSPYTLEPYHGMTHISGDEINEGAKMGLKVDEDSTIGLITLKETEMNLDLSDLLTTAANWPNTARAAVWTDRTNADPQADFNTATEAISLASRGTLMANTCVMGLSAFNNMMRTDRVQELVKYTLHNKEQSISAIKDLFGVSNIYVVPDAYNSAKKGATKNLTRIWGDSVWFGYIEQNPSRMKPSAIYGVGLTPKVVGKGNPFGIQVSSITKMGGEKFEDGRAGKKVIVEINTNFKQVARDLGYLITGVLTA